MEGARVRGGAERAEHVRAHAGGVSHLASITSDKESPARGGVAMGRVAGRGREEDVWSVDSGAFTLCGGPSTAQATSKDHPLK